VSQSSPPERVKLFQYGDAWEVVSEGTVPEPGWIEYTRADLDTFACLLAKARTDNLRKGFETVVAVIREAEALGGFGDTRASLSRDIWLRLREAAKEMGVTGL